MMSRAERAARIKQEIYCNLDRLEDPDLFIHCRNCVGFGCSMCPEDDPDPTFDFCERYYRCDPLKGGDPDV